MQDRTDGAIEVNLPDIQLVRTWASRDVPRQARWEEYPYPPATMDAELLDQLATFVDLRAHTNRSQAAIALLYLHSYLTTDDVATHGYDFSVRSNLPVGAGLGSSASYSVCLATALLQLNGYLKSATTGLSVAEQRDLVNQWAFQAEKVIHGNPSGIDNTVSTLGGAVMFKKGESIEPLPGFQSLRFLLTNTRVPRETQVQVMKVRELQEKFPSVVNTILDAIHEISVSCKDLFAQDGLDRTHLLSRFGELVDINHGLLAALSVSHPALEKVREISSKVGLKSKLTGAGGGGCALTLIRDDTTSETVATVKQLLEAEGFECLETQVGGPGAGILTLESPTTIAEFLSHDRAYFETTQNWAYFEMKVQIDDKIDPTKPRPRNVPRPGYAFRDNDRIQFQSEEFASMLWNKCGLRDRWTELWQHPKWGLESVHGESITSGPRNKKRTRHAVGLSRNIRFYRYQTGQSFGAHYDESVIDTSESLGETVSEYTVLIYLNGERDSDLLGGETVFYPKGKKATATPGTGGSTTKQTRRGNSKTGSVADSSTGTAATSAEKERSGANGSLSYMLPNGGVAVKPERGLLLVHKHGDECMLHEALMVYQGFKYVLRTDVVYEP
ncbi:hypothetical protein EDD11_005890 [Mortierella claussenii]|nr:hypothetical protein EDD11_005890 [Mortierella claussenii]